MHAAQMLESEKTAADLFKEFDKSGDGNLHPSLLHSLPSPSSRPTEGSSWLDIVYPRLFDKRRVKRSAVGGHQSGYDRENDQGG